MSVISFPVYLAVNGFVPPENGTYYVVAKEGIFLNVERLHGSSLVKVDSIPFLDQVRLNPKFSLPNIPATIVYQAKAFFKAVFEKLHSESYLTLLYSKKLKNYKLWCPKQTVSYGSVNYDRTDTVPVEDRDYIGSEGDGWQMVGTIHSHCDFSAFHSGTDEADEATFDGVHLTFGHVNSNKFSIASSICFNNNRTKMNPTDVADGIVSDSEEEVTENKEFKYRGVTYKSSKTRTEYWFRLDSLSVEEQQSHENFLNDTLPVWLEKVDKVVGKFDETPSSSWSYKEGKNNQRWIDAWRTYDYRHDANREYNDDFFGIREWDGD